MMPSQQRPVCDYEGSDYRTRFWKGQGREYEDRVERIALRRLMPPAAETLIDIGAGFGRLADEYAEYRRVVLFDYSRSLLREAQQRLDPDPRFLYVAGNWYQMPFVEGLFATMVQVRTIHHAADVPALFAELSRIARPGGHYVLEYPNKRNLKAILRYVLGRQEWSPFAPEPVEFVELNYDFHPGWMRRRLEENQFRPHTTLAVSHFRLALFKKIVPTSWLVTLDGLLQFTGAWWQLSPSVFVSSRHAAHGPAAPPDHFFACPICRTPLGKVRSGALICSGCSRRWPVEDGLYDFKEPLS